jgi:hypothetical protein
MLIRDELFLVPAFHTELYGLLSTAAREEVLCQVQYVPPGQCQLLSEIGHILEVGEHWLTMTSYSLEPEATPEAPETLFSGLVHLPTRSVVGIASGPSRFRNRIEEALSQQRAQLAQGLQEPPVESNPAPEPEANSWLATVSRWFEVARNSIF